MWSDYLAAARRAADKTDLDIAVLESLVTRGQPGYVLDQQGYVAFQPALVISARREITADR